MAQVVCTRPVQATATATKTAMKPATPLVGQVQRVSSGANVQTISKPLSLRQSQTLRQKQSLAFAQIMLHASFGTLFYLREFLPLSCFGDRNLLSPKRQDSIISYDDFLDDSPTPSVASGKRGQPLKIILRNQNARADAVLDLLEHGIFDALEKNHLEAVQLTVYVDKEKPSHVLESYTFSFHYTKGIQELKRGLETVSLEATVHSTEVKTFRTAKLGLEMIIRRLITLSTFLPILPKKRFLGIHLFYTSDCPKKYEPRGFQPSTQAHILYPRDNEWKKETQACGTMDSGCHSVGLKITSLRSSRVIGPGEDDASGIQVPDTLEYSERTELGGEIGVESDEAYSSQITAADQEESSSQESAEVQESTQTRRDNITKNMLQNMLESSARDSELIPTQADPLLNTNPSKAAQPLKPCLSQAQATKIRDRVLYSQLTQSVNGDNSQSGHAEVNCQCGWNKPDKDMLKCDFCKTRQHLTCYGFLHPKDEKIPATHACYRCLLGSDEIKVSRQIETLVLLRQALKIIIEEGYPRRIKEFAHKLHCSGQEVVQITDLLRKNGFLQPTPGSKQKGFAETGLPKFLVPDSEEMRQRLRQEIFNPFAKISHHYMIPSVPVNRLNSATSIPESVNGDIDKQSDQKSPVAKESLDTHTVPNSEPIVISEDEDYSKGQALAPSAMDKGQPKEREYALSTSPPSSPPHSQFSPASRAHERLQSSFRGGTERVHSPFYSGTHVESCDELTKEQQQQPYKRRKLSNAAYPIDIGNSSSDESS